MYIHMHALSLFLRASTACCSPLLRRSHVAILGNMSRIPFGENEAQQLAPWATETLGISAPSDAIDNALTVTNSCKKGGAARLAELVIWNPNLKGCGRSRATEGRNAQMNQAQSTV